MSYENLSYPAYLRPKKSRYANTRLFFGVEWETSTGKSKIAYNLKAAHIVLTAAAGNNIYSGLIAAFIIYSVRCMFTYRIIFDGKTVCEWMECRAYSSAFIIFFRCHDVYGW